MLILWFVTRLIWLPTIIFQIATQATDYFGPDISSFKPIISLFVVYLGTLNILHLYWFILIVGMVIHHAKTGEVADTQENPNVDANKINNEKENTNSVQ